MIATALLLAATATADPTVLAPYKVYGAADHEVYLTVSGHAAVRGGMLYGAAYRQAIGDWMVVRGIVEGGQIVDGTTASLLGKVHLGITTPGMLYGGLGATYMYGSALATTGLYGGATPVVPELIGGLRVPLQGFVTLMADARFGLYGPSTGTFGIGARF